MKVITNTAVTLDGKISSSKNEGFRLGTARDLERMHEIKAMADAVLVGGQTFRHWPDPTGRNQKKEGILNVILSRSLDLPFTSDFLQVNGSLTLVLTETKSVPPEYPVEVVTSYPEKATPEWILAQLESRGVETLLVEAGGSVIFQFLEAQLIDELYVTVCPKILGGTTAPTLADGEGFDSKSLRNLELLDCQQVENELYLHYQVLK